MSAIPEAIRIEPVIFHYPASASPFKQQTDRLHMMTEKIDNLSQTHFSRICSLTLKYVGKAFRENAYSISTVKILTAAAYGGILGLGVLTSYSSINLLYNSNFSSAFSSDMNTRVNFANYVTNAGALFSAVTDIPAITYTVYLFLLKNAYKKAIHEVEDEKYHSCIKEQTQNLNPEMREELYQQHISKLQSLGIADYYLRPDPLSKTGTMHAAMAPRLREIDHEIDQGITIRAIWKNCMDSFKNASCAGKLAKVAVGTAGAISILCTQALAAFIILENGILVRDTPVSDLFSSNSASSLNEAFYLTQLGNAFCSLTSFAAATYCSYWLFLRTAYKKAMREKICDCFANRFGGLSSSMSLALHRIREIKLKNV